MSRPIGVDLFAGAGGMSLGFEQAGFDVAAAVELDPVHAAVHAYNAPHTRVLARSVVGLTGQEIRLAAGIGRKAVDVVFGGAPCQGFSLIGQRAMDDPRNGLVREFVRIVKELRARYFVFENVKGLTLGPHRQFLDEIIQEFSDAGYNVRLPYRVLNALDYGVPQSRERLFLIGARKGLPLPEYPSPTSSADDDGLALLPKTPTCRDALQDIPDAEQFDELILSDAVETGKWGTPSVYGQEMRCLTNDAWHFGFVRNWNPWLLSSSNRTDHTAISRRRFAHTEPGSVEPISRFYRLSGDGYSNTLRAGTDSARGAFTSPRPIHFEFPRCITVREMARLHGYPDWFRFHSTKWHGARQIGNSVPPPLARAVAGTLIEALQVVPERPAESIGAQNPELLRMEVGEAAKHWNVPNPIGRRNKKSGAKKRKQTAIEAEARRRA